MNIKYNSNKKNFLLLFIYTITSVGCSSTKTIASDGPPEKHINASKIPNAKPKYEPYSSSGNPPFYTVNNKKYIVHKTAHNFHQQGIASWYGTKFHGKKTSNGETYNMLAMTAAHKILPIPTYLKVTNLDNNKQVIVRINDRGPFIGNRIIDLSYVAAKKLGMLKKGTARVYLEAISSPNTESKQTTTVTRLKHIYLQLGAFKKAEKAINFANKIRKNINYTITTHLENLNNINIYKTLAGPIPSIDDVESIAINIEKHTKIRPLMIMK